MHEIRDESLAVRADVNEAMNEVLQVFQEFKQAAVYGRFAFAWDKVAAVGLRTNRQGLGFQLGQRHRIALANVKIECALN